MTQQVRLIAYRHIFSDTSDADVEKALQERFGHLAGFAVLKNNILCDVCQVTYPQTERSRLTRKLCDQCNHYYDVCDKCPLPEKCPLPCEKLRQNSQ